MAVASGAGRMFVRFFALGVVRRLRTRRMPSITRKLTLKEAVTLAVQNSRDLALARLQYGLVQREAGVARLRVPSKFLYGDGRRVYQRISSHGGRGRARHFQPVL